jgi:hypothetical protein
MISCCLCGRMSEARNMTAVCLIVTQFQEASKTRRSSAANSRYNMRNYLKLRLSGRCPDIHQLSTYIHSVWTERRWKVCRIHSLKCASQAVPVGLFITRARECRSFSSLKLAKKKKNLGSWYDLCTKESAVLYVLISLPLFFSVFCAAYWCFF